MGVVLHTISQTFAIKNKSVAVPRSDLDQPNSLVPQEGNWPGGEIIKSMKTESETKTQSTWD